MTMSNEKEGQQPWTFIRLLKAGMTMIAALTSLAGLFNFTHQMLDSGPALSLALLSRERLTAIPEVPGLTSEFKFDARPVKDLWKVRLRLQNIGRKTILFDGPNKNVVTPSVVLSISPGFELLGRQIESNSHVIKMEPLATNGYSFNSLQWRRDEQITFSLFLERKDTTLIPKPECFTFERILIDGEISVTDLTSEQAGPPRPLIDRFAPAFGSTIRFMLYVAFALLGFVGMTMITIFPIVVYRDARKKLSWRKENLLDARDHLVKTLGDKGYGRFLKSGATFSSTFALATEAGKPPSLKLRRQNIWDGFAGKEPDNPDWVSDEKDPNPLLEALVIILWGVFVTAIFASAFASIYTM